LQRGLAGVVEEADHKRVARERSRRLGHFGVVLDVAQHVGLHAGELMRHHQRRYLAHLVVNGDLVGLVESHAAVAERHIEAVDCGRGRARIIRRTGGRGKKRLVVVVAIARRIRRCS
jgi:hypothetical protein